ncbi:MAG TPA: hypothetical protein VJN71_03510 [Nitrososphaerales archaeon]|nr:hypothetical protein [Nitrososphaerales archaeon]
MPGSQILDLVRNYENYRSQTLNLIPSENLLSPGVLEALSSTLAGRYSGKPESYGGSGIFHQIWKNCEKLAAAVFTCKFSSVAPVSGHLAGMMAIDSVCKRRDTMLVLSSKFGGYKGYNSGFIPDVFGLKVAYLPFDEKRFDINSDSALKLIKKTRPAAVILGATVFLFPHPVKEISEVVRSYGGKVIYDGSHVMGLVAGGEFQSPLDEGADLLLGSTHKTLFGPQGGIILSNNDDLIKKIESGYLYRFIDNFHLNRIAALGVALEEMKIHGRKYAKRVIQNSKALAEVLDAKGLPVAARESGFTRSHQVFLNYGNQGERSATH